MDVSYLFANFTTAYYQCGLMLDCDIRFVDKEITPFGGLSLLFKMLEKCQFDKRLEQCDIPVQGSNRGYKPPPNSSRAYLSVYGAVQVVSDTLMWPVMMPRFENCSVGNVGRTTWLASVISIFRFHLSLCERILWLLYSLLYCLEVPGAAHVTALGQEWCVEERGFVVPSMESIVFEYGFELAVGENPVFKTLTTGLVKDWILVLFTGTYECRTELVVYFLGQNCACGV